MYIDRGIELEGILSETNLPDDRISVGGISVREELNEALRESLGEFLGYADPDRDVLVRLEGEIYTPDFDASQQAKPLSNSPVLVSVGYDTGDVKLFDKFFVQFKGVVVEQTTGVFTSYDGRTNLEENMLETVFTHLGNTLNTLGGTDTSLFLTLIVDQSEEPN